MADTEYGQFQLLCWYSTQPPEQTAALQEQVFVLQETKRQ